MNKNTQIRTHTRHTAYGIRQMTTGIRSMAYGIRHTHAIRIVEFQAFSVYQKHRTSYLFTRCTESLKRRGGKFFLLLFCIHSTTRRTAHELPRQTDQREHWNPLGHKRKRRDSGVREGKAPPLCYCACSASSDMRSTYGNRGQMSQLMIWISRRTRIHV